MIVCSWLLVAVVEVLPSVFFSPTNNNNLHPQPSWASARGVATPPGKCARPNSCCASVAQTMSTGSCYSAVVVVGNSSLFI